jgi:hypothetical protein
VVAGWFVLRRQLGTLRVLRSCWKTIVAGAVMGVFIHVVQPQGRLMLFVVIVASALIYAGVLLLLRVADAEELELIRRALRARGG